MKIKSVVKVMNFHALLRVDKSRKEAEKYREMEKQLTDMISVIMNSRNFLFDQKIVKPNPDMPRLEIYIGSDLGFCGSINSSISRIIKSSDCEKVLIGKKIIHKADEKDMLTFKRGDFDIHAEELHKLLTDAVIHRKYSSIQLIYNHYYNISHIETVKKQLYPIEMELKQNTGVMNDYVLESDDGNLLENIIIQYLEYELRIAWINAYASENVTRQSTTSESLKKIDEIENEEVIEQRKEKKMKSFKKVLDSYINEKGMEGNA